MTDETNYIIATLENHNSSLKTLSELFVRLKAQLIELENAVIDLEQKLEKISK